MSWSFSATGRAKALRLKLLAALANSKCVEPEETIKASVATTIAMALGAMPDEQAVKVEASGHQTGAEAATGRAVNVLKISVEPLWGFVENDPEPTAAELGAAVRREGLAGQ